MAPLALGLSLLLLGGAVGAVAGAREQSRAEKHGRSEAAAAQKALAKGKFDSAIRHAEAAVAFEPDLVAYRMTLAQSYLKAGRFTSARDAFADVLTLDDDNGKAALNYALAQIGTGDWAGARKTLDAHSATIPVSDRGLAIALAGDPATAVEVLAAAARAPGADAKVRQNYALALGLAGRWREAETVVAIDLAPGDVAHRILEWSAFSRPTSASDQVATLLGVTSIVDSGRPAALALNRTTQAEGPALASAAPIDSFMPKYSGAAAPEAPVVAPVAVAATVPERNAASIGPSIAGVVFAERKEVVQAIPVSVAAASKVARLTLQKLVLASRTTSRTAGRGTFFVQLGAYHNAGVAHDAWNRATHGYTALASHQPQGMSVTRGGRSFYRLSVGGFARGDARAVSHAWW